MLMSTTQHSSLTCELLWLGHSSLSLSLSFLERESTAKETYTAILRVLSSKKNSIELNPDSIPGPDFLSAEDTKIGKTAFSEMKWWKGNRLYIITLNVGISRAGKIPGLNPTVKSR